MRETTFIRPVPDMIEDLSMAGRYANEKSHGAFQVTLLVTYLGVLIKVERNKDGVTGQALTTCERRVGWLELSEAKVNVLIPAIDLAIEDSNRSLPGTPGYAGRQK